MINRCQVGVVAYALLSGVEPFYDREVNVLKHNNQFVRYDFDDPVWQTVSESAKDFIRKALQLQAENRINPEESKRHPWMCDFFFNNHSKGNPYGTLNSPSLCSHIGSESLDVVDIKNKSIYFRETGSEVHTKSVSQQIISLSHQSRGESSLSNTVGVESVASHYRNEHIAVRNNNNNSCIIA